MGDSEIIIFITFITLISLAFIIVIVMLVLRYRKRKLLYEHEQQLAKETHRMELLNVKTEVQSETMHQIGIEIHDSIAQKLTLASLHILRTEHEYNHFPIREALLQSSELINESLDDLRLLSRRLQMQIGAQTDLVENLRAEANKVRQLKICDVLFDTDRSSIMVDNQIGLTIQRLVQELIQNSLKHAGCSCIHIRLEAGDHELKMMVQDDGKGFQYHEKIDSPGMGLKNIEKRAALIGAITRFDSKPNEGTRFTLTLAQ